MKFSSFSLFVSPIAFVLVGCATPSPKNQDPVQLAQIASRSDVPAPVTTPTFADSELAKIPELQAAMDRCRDLGTKHKVTTRVMDSGPMKGNVAIDVTCEPKP